MISYSFFIALAAVCLSFETQLLIEKTIVINATTFLIFFSTVFVYNNHRLQALLDKHRRGFFEKETVTDIYFLRGLTIIAITGIIVSAFFL